MSSYNYNNIYSNSFFNEKNMNAKYSPSTLSSNMIPCNTNSAIFHYETSVYLNLITSLYIELKEKEKTFDYNINKFNDCINKLNIIIDTTTTDTTVSSSGSTIITPLNKLSKLEQDGLFPNASNYNFTFYVKTFEKYASSQNDMYSICYPDIKAEILNSYKPNFGKYPTILNTNHFNFIFGGISTDNNVYNRANIANGNMNNSKLKSVIKDILNQTPQNIIGYLLYQKINYNIILYNIEIQNSIRRNYLNNNTFSGNADDTIAGRLNLFDFSNNPKYITATHINVLNIINKINDCIENIKLLSSNTFPYNDYLTDKTKYTDKINVFNKLRDEYETILDKLNMSIKLYSQQINNYNKIKGYASIVIIILIMIIVFIISLSILPIFKTKTKNSIYIITLISLIIITYIYYNTFKFVNLYEQFVQDESDFTNNKSLLNCAGVNGLFPYNSTNNNHKINHSTLYNTLNPVLQNYTNAINTIFNDLRMNVYTIGNKSFTQDSNVLLYKLYLEKRRQLEVNRIKLTNLFNIIEVIKKQTNYLFNIILIILLMTIVLLIGLVLYSSVPQLIYPIMILCIILIVIIMIYFAFTIIQPTRMMANKNYWAIANPSSKTTGKI